MYKLWRDRNPNSRPNMNANTLQTQRRNTERTLSLEQINEIRGRVLAALGEGEPQDLKKDEKEAEEELGNEPNTIERPIREEIAELTNIPIEQRKPLKKSGKPHK